MKRAADDDHGAGSLPSGAFFKGRYTIPQPGNPFVDLVGPHPFAGWQAAFAPLLSPGARNNWKSHDFKEFSNVACDALLDAVKRLPTDVCELFVGHLGGRVNPISPEATPSPRRNVRFIVNMHTRWRETAQDEACINWARGLFKSLTPHALGAV